MEQQESRDPVELLIGEFKKLPGVGAKSAQRITFHLLKSGEEMALSLADAIRNLKSAVLLCNHCNHITDRDPCKYCSDSRRDHSTILVVEEPFNVFSIEKGGDYRGLYHVLHGAISPINGVGPEDLKIKSLLVRIEENVQEVILATNPTSDGEATALYLSKLLKPLEVRVSRIAFGIPIGSDIEYADSATLSRALAGRSNM